MRGAGGGHLLRNRGSVIGALRAQAARLSTAGMGEARRSRKGGNLHWLHAHCSRSIWHFERWWQLPMLTHLVNQISDRNVIKRWLRDGLCRA